MDIEELREHIISSLREAMDKYGSEEIDCSFSRTLSDLDQDGRREPLDEITYTLRLKGYRSAEDS